MSEELYLVLIVSFLPRHTKLLCYGFYKIEPTLLSSFGCCTPLLYLVLFAPYHGNMTKLPHVKGISPARDL